MIDKKVLLKHCTGLIDRKLNDLQNVLEDYKKDLLSEVKSSAGDKHETGRAMLQLEMEKLGKQYQIVLAQKEVLQKIDISLKDTAQVGSVVVTANGVCYFLATSIGQVAIENNQVLVISINSPIGKLLLGKQKGDELVFNGKKIKVNKIS